MNLNKLTKILNINMQEIVAFLEKHAELGDVPQADYNSIVNDKQVKAITKHFKLQNLELVTSVKNNSVIGRVSDSEIEDFNMHPPMLNVGVKVVGQIDLDALNQSTRPKKKTGGEKRKESEDKGKFVQEGYPRIKNVNNHTIVVVSSNRQFLVQDNTSLRRLTQILNVREIDIVSFLYKHPELGIGPKVSPSGKFNGKLNKKQVIATIEYFKDTTSINYNSENKKEEIESHNTNTIYTDSQYLQFKQGHVVFNFLNKVFILKEEQFNEELNKLKKDQTIFEGRMVGLTLNNKTMSFNFANNSLHEKLKQLCIKMCAKKTKERKGKQEKKKESQKNNQIITIHANLMRFKFYKGIAYYTYNDEQYTYRNYKFAEDYNKIFTIAKTNVKCKAALESKLIPITLNLSDKTFVCYILNYLDFCMQKFSDNTPVLKDSQNIENNDNADYTQRIYCKIENIEFFDGYYKIWVVENGVKVTNIHPLTIKDVNSLACLQIVNKYFATRLPNDIIIVYTSNQVLRITNEFKLQKYVKTLRKEKDVPADWWNRSDNKEFKTLDNYRKIPTRFVNKEVSYKNLYIDYLVSSYQEKNPLLIAYEIFNGQEEKCFVFHIDIDENKSAIIYENININRATNVFIIDKQDYEQSMNLIFNFFTDENLSRKRMSIRTNQNPPEKFKAITIKTINHNNLNIWINKLNEFLVPVAHSATYKTLEHIQFVSGLKIKNNNTRAINTKEIVSITNLHDEIKEKLYLQLSKEYGSENVGTEISIGKKKIDLVVKNSDSYNIYEIKTDPDVRICIREAIGQIIDYAYFECNDNINKMTIVGPTKINQEAYEYLENIRIKHNLPIYYESVS